MESIDFLIIVLCLILISKSAKSDFIEDNGTINQLEKDSWMQSNAGKLVMSKFKEIETRLEKQDGIIQQLTTTVKEKQDIIKLVTETVASLEKEVKLLKQELVEVEDANIRNNGESMLSNQPATFNPHDNIVQKTTTTANKSDDHKMKAFKTDYIKSNVSDVGINSFETKTNKISLLNRQHRSAGNVAFSAYLTMSYIPNSRNTIKCDGILTNVGNHYNKYTGVFTAPINGLYFFTYHIIASHTGLFFVQLQNNGGKQVTAPLNPKEVTVSSGNSAVLVLSAGDSIWLEIVGKEGNEIYLKDGTTFSGFLLF